MTTKSRADLVIGLIQGKQTTKGEDDDSDNETRQVPRRLIAEGVVLVSFLVGLLATHHENDLVGGISHRMDSLGEHRRGPSKCPCNGLRYRDRKVGGGSCDDRFAASLRRVGWLLGPVRPLGSVRLAHVISFRRSSPRAT